MLRLPSKAGSTVLGLLTFFFLAQCATPGWAQIKPLYTTERVKYDTDDPAVWINKANPSESLIIGTDKEEDGALYVFNLQGKIIADKVVRNLKRPNNVDVGYGLVLQGKKVDIAVATERLTHELRVYSLPDMQAIDNGGIKVFAGETNTDYNAPMGIALYERPSDGKIFAIVSRKAGPTNGTYLWEYLLEDDGQGNVKGTLVRKFGAYSGRQEIEAIAVDDELGYVYYSDERRGVRKYYADPEKGNEELAFFANTGFTGDQEGISIYKIEDGTGYILVSDQQANEFHIYPREGTAGNPNDHRLLKVVKVSTNNSDGSETVNYPLLPDFPKGLFVAMSDNKTFQLYRWEDIAGNDLKIQPPVVDTPTTNTKGLVGYWKMDENSGTTLLDATTNLNNATLTGSPVWVPGISGAALQLDGSNEYATVPDNASLDLTDAITIAAWVKPEKLATQYIVKKAIYGETDGYELSLSANGEVFFRLNQLSTGNTLRLNSTVDYPTDGHTWMHIAATFDGATIKLYINGVENGSKTLEAPTAIKTNSTALAIGAQPNGISDFQGAIDQAQLYNIALSAKEISQLVTTAPSLAMVGMTGISVNRIGQKIEPKQPLQAYPNPFTSKTSITFTTSQTGDYTLMLYDNKGAALSVLKQGKAVAGQLHFVEVDGSTLSKGLYMVRLQTATNTQTIKVLLVR